MKPMIPWKWFAFALIGVFVALFVIAVLGTVGEALSG
jgi:Flp pilus assembly pilin Flp